MTLATSQRREDRRQRSQGWDRADNARSLLPSLPSPEAFLPDDAPTGVWGGGSEAASAGDGVFSVTPRRDPQQDAQPEMERSPLVFR